MMPTTPSRTLGRYYTPDWIARWMVARALATCDVSLGEFSWRILDPACGDGAFLLPVLDWLAESRGIEPGDVPGRLAIVSDHVFGTDADLDAIEALRSRVAEWIGGDPQQLSQQESVLTSQFVCGDALTGPDWTGEDSAPPWRTESVSSLVLHHASDTRHNHPPPIDWSAAFPQVAAEGGFNLVIGNPPYRRERHTKREFDRIAATPLGRRWRTARMDLWHYFLHRGLDLLKPGGLLSFIVNSYWTSSTAAEPLRRRLSAETSMEQMVLLGPARLFRGVSGRHMIFRTRKSGATENGNDPQSHCEVLDLSKQRRDQIQSQFEGRTPLPSISYSYSSPYSSPSSSPLKRPKPSQPRQIAPTNSIPLGDLYDVRQGIAENPPFVTRAAAELLDDPSLAGRGVFVLTADEVTSLELGPSELSLLRPYYSLASVGRFHVAPGPSHQLLYLTRRTAPGLDGFPAVARHLARFRPILERRREVQSGQIAWWHLHWPREERLFTSPRVLCLQMGHEPRFAFAERPTYVGFSMHVIVERPPPAARTLSLPALTAVLNSTSARQWFESSAKRRGAHLDISGTVLKQFPLPASVPERVLEEFEKLTRGWLDTAGCEERLREVTKDLGSDQWVTRG